MNAETIIEKEKRRVIKICNSTTEFKNELYIYKKNLPFVPKLLDHNSLNTLIIEYIEATRIGDLLLPDFVKLANLFYQLHALEHKGERCICHADTNPKNYLYSAINQQYYMIDFSNWVYDYPESDLIHFLLFWASIFDHSTFRKTYTDFVNSYQKHDPINPILWEMLIPETIEKFDQRRKKYDKY